MTALGSLLIALPALLTGQGNPDVLTAVRAGKMGLAVDLAREQARAAPTDPVAWHVLGVLEASQERVKEAEDAFSHEIEVGAHSLPARTGLAELAYRGSALQHDLLRTATTLGLDAGLASARNNRGAMRLLQGNVDSGFPDIDQAAVIEPNWGVPWANGAVAWQIRGRPDKAIESASHALDLNEKTSHLYATLAQAELSASQTDQAGDDVDRALEADPDDPYALLARAKLLKALARSRDAERSLWQALAETPLAAVDSLFLPTAGAGNALGGNAAESDLDLVHRGVSPNAVHSAILRTDRHRVEDRDDAYQLLDQGEAVLGGHYGVFFVSGWDSRGGRPGADSPEVGITPDPLATYRFRQAIGSWQDRIPLSGGAALTLHGAYRSADIDTDFGTPGTSPLELRDHQTIAEARIDSGAGRVQTTAGLSWSRVSRTGQEPLAIEPTEQILPVGKTVLLTGYALQRHVLSRNARLAVGGVLGGESGRLVLQPITVVSLQLTGSKAISFGIRPRLNDASSDLFPLDSIAQPPQTNPINRTFDEPDEFNHTPTLLGDQGRYLNYELNFGSDLAGDNRLETVLFHRRMSDTYVQAADSRVSTSLLLTPVTQGESTGIGERLRMHLTSRLSLRLWACVQRSSGTISTPTYSASDYPAHVPTDRQSLPSFPALQSIGRLDWTGPAFDIGLEVAYVGKRTRMVTTSSGGTPITFVSDAPAATGIHLFLHRRMGRDSDLTFALFNLGKANFYPGYPASTTGLLGMAFRF